MLLYTPVSVDIFHKFMKICLTGSCKLLGVSIELKYQSNLKNAMDATEVIWYGQIDMNSLSFAYSNYKSHHKEKSLMCITPNAAFFQFV